MAITTFDLQTGAAAGAAPFCFGHFFKKGDVKSAEYLDADLVDWQATPMTTWPDGSLRHAVIAGIVTNTTVGGTKSITLFANTTPRSGSALTEASLALVLPTTTLQCGAETITLNNLVGTAALHRTVVTGPVVSNFIYRKQLAGSSHLVAWFDVRVYKGGTVEIFPWIENCFTFVPGPTNDVRTYTLTIGVAQKFSQTLDIKARTRVPLLSGNALSYWSTDPQLTPKFNTAYLMSTRMVPHYGIPASQTLLASLPTTYQPNWLGQTDPRMGNAGYQPHIGVLPEWQGAFLSSGGDARAFRATVFNGMAAGSWHIHFRNELTGEPLKHVDYSDIWQDTGSSNGPTSFPTETGGVNETGLPEGDARPDKAHQPSLAYLPWLLTARWYFLDELLFWCGWNYINANYVFRGGSDGIVFRTGEVRDKGWTLRTLAQALAATPSTHPAFAGLKNSWEKNIDRFETAGVLGTSDAGFKNNLGWLGVYSGDGTSLYFNGTQNTHWYDAPWQQLIITLALAHAWDLDLPQSAASKASHLAIRNFSYQVPLNLAGDGSQGFLYRRMVLFQMPIASNWSQPLGNWLPNWGAVYSTVEALYNSGGTAPLQPLPPGTSIHAGDGAVTADMWAQSSAAVFTMAGLAYAVDHQIDGADDAWSRVTTASNYSATPLADKNTWAITPSPDIVTEEPPVTVPTGSVRLDTTPLLPGAMVMGMNGLGILGSAIPSTGASGASFLYNDLDLPADANREVLAVITQLPAAGTLLLNEDSSFQFTAPDGVYTMTYALELDGQAVGSSTVTLTVGAPAAPPLLLTMAHLVSGGALTNALVLPAIEATISTILEGANPVLYAKNDAAKATYNFTRRIRRN